MAFLVSLLVLALLVLLAVPGLMVLWKGTGAAPVAIFYVLLLFGLGAWHVGLPVRAQADLTRPTVGLTDESGMATPLCAQIIQQSRQAGVILGRPNSRQVQVNRAYWAELPEQVKEAITSCLRAPARPGAPQNEIEIVQLPAR